jgi:hypothetical protein
VQTAVFQQGANGYTGVRDTFVSRLTWDTPPQVTRNYGQNTALVVDRNGGSNALLRFDLAPIPANGLVLSATLELYNEVDSPSFARRIELFQVLRDWDEGAEVAAPVNAAGKHGATGNNAFEYGGGSPPAVAWRARGLRSGRAGRRRCDRRRLVSLGCDGPRAAVGARQDAQCGLHPARHHRLPGWQS